MRCNVHAGHNPDNLKACGAIGLIKESTEARKVKDEVIRLLKANGDTVYDCTVNDGKSATDVLNKIVSKTKRNRVDLDISIHFNSGVNDKKGDGKTTGVEVLVFRNSGLAGEKAKSVCNSISSLGLKNRGVKIRQDLAVLKRTVAPAILIECCFVDDYDDCKKYDYKSMAKAIVEGITGKKIAGNSTSNTSRSYKNGDYNRKGKVVATNGTGLNVRAERSGSSQKVTNLKEGTVIEVSYCLNNWFSTYDYKHNGKPCYVCGSYIEFI